MTSSSQRLALLEAVVEQSFNAVLITDANLANGGPLIVYVNPAFCTMTGYTAEELIGLSPRILQGADTDPQVIERLRQCLSERLFFRRVDGQLPCRRQPVCRRVENHTGARRCGPGLQLCVSAAKHQPAHPRRA